MDCHIVRETLTFLTFLTSENIEYIVENYTYEAGVRDIKRKIEDLVMKLNIDRLYGNNLFTEEDYFGKNKIKNQKIKFKI